MSEGACVSALNIGVFNSRSICNKTAATMELLYDHKIDICFITESWLKVNDAAKFAEIHDHGFDIFNAPRRGRGGGVAFIFNPSRVSLIRNNVNKYSSFEVLEAIIKTSTDSLRLSVIYRSTQITSKQKYQDTKLALFFEEFSDYLDTLATKSGRPLICGDFNFHIEDSTNYSTTRFKSLYESKGFIQHVTDPTHIAGSTLDLVLTRDSVSDHIPISHVDAEPNTGTASDHFLIHFSVSVGIGESQSSSIDTREIRQLSKIDIEKFKDDVRQRMPSPQNLNSLLEAVEAYDNILSQLLDLHAPAETKDCKRSNSAWWNGKCNLARREKRRAERQYKKHRDPIKLELYKEKLVEASIIIDRERNTFFEKKLGAAAGNPKATYKIINNLLDKEYGANKLPNEPSNEKLADDFKSFFSEKVNSIYDDIKERIKTEIPTVINTEECSKGNEYDFKAFKIFTTQEVADVIRSLNDKSCPSDPIPTWLMKNCLEELLPLITLIVNESLQAGIFTDQLKSAIVRTVL